MDKDKGVLLLLLVGAAVTVGFAANSEGGISYGSEYEEFNSYADYILKTWESIYINNSNEVSKFGIVKQWYPNEDIENMTLKRAKEIIYVDYWQKIKASKMNRKLRLIYFDAAINQGQPTAVRMLQTLAGVSVDGVAGPQTIAASKNITSYMYAMARYDRYDEVVANNPDKAKYLDGWRRRIYEVQSLQITLEGE